MTQPAVNIEENDGALGVLPPSAGKLHALVGCSSDGPLNEPATFGRAKDVVGVFKRGPLVEAAAHAIATYGKPVVLVRTAVGADGSVTLVPGVKAGSSGITLLTSEGDDPDPADDVDVMVRILTDGTRGQAGITYQINYEGGKSKAWGPVLALGTADKITLPVDEVGAHIGFAIGAGTLKKGDTFGLRTVAHQWSGEELGEALDALAASVVNWEGLQVVGALDGDAVDLIETKMVAMQARNKQRYWLGNTRLPEVDETPSEFLADQSAEFASKVSTLGGIGYAACRLTSAVTSRKQRRPVAFAVSALQASVSEEINIADPNTFELTGVSIVDAKGNPEEHNESVFPGADDARFITLRTHEDFPGVYVNRMRLFSASTSDFQLVPHRRVMNIARGVLNVYFTKRLNKPVYVDQATGFLLEEERLEIEYGATAALRAALLAKPKASGAIFALNKTDDVLSTKTINGDAKVIPLAYPEFINLGLGFFNPALQVIAVAA